MIKLDVRDKRFTIFSSDGHEIPFNSGQVPSNYGHVFKKSSNTDSFSTAHNERMMQASEITPEKLALLFKLRQTVRNA